MPSKQLLLLLTITILACSAGCAPFFVPVATPIPFSTITLTLPTLPPPAPTSMPSAVALPSVTAPPRVSVTASRTSPPKATATPTRPSPTATSHPGLIVESFLVGPGQPGRLYANLREQNYSMVDHQLARLVVSDDLAATWSPFSGGLPVSQGCMIDVNLDYATTDVLFASTCQGIHRWAGGKWSRISDLRTWMVAVTYKQPNNLWASVVDMKPAPVVRSSDGGTTWQTASQRMVHFNGIANIGIDPRDARTLYAIVWPKYGGTYLRRKTGENQWQEMPTPPNNSHIDVGMTIDGATGALYVTVNDMVTNPAQSHWQVWCSSNPTVEMNSVKWEKVYDFGNNQWATMLASGWSPQGLALYARVTLATGESAVFRSLDIGRTRNAIKIP